MGCLPLERRTEVATSFPLLSSPEQLGSRWQSLHRLLAQIAQPIGSSIAFQPTSQTSRWPSVPLFPTDHQGSSRIIAIFISVPVKRPWVVNDTEERQGRTNDTVQGQLIISVMGDQAGLSPPTSPGGSRCEQEGTTTVGQFPGEGTGHSSAHRTRLQQPESPRLPKGLNISAGG